MLRHSVDICLDITTLHIYIITVQPCHSASSLAQNLQGDWRFPLTDGVISARCRHVLYIWACIELFEQILLSGLLSRGTQDYLRAAGCGCHIRKHCLLHLQG